MSDDYNLLTQKWIPALHNDGNFHWLNTIEVLKQAQTIAAIAFASPFDTFAAHRFLLTLLYWKADLSGGVEQVRNSLLEGNVPSEVIHGIIEEVNCFDLFDDIAPFLQDSSAKNVQDSDRKSVGYLFSEFATGTNIAHFHHGDDKAMRLCLRCATIGMLRVVPWTQSGGRRMFSAVHGAPPIMAIAIGDNLSITLGLNFVPLEAEAGYPKWSGHFKPTNPDKPISYLEAFTWNPRRIHIPTPEMGTCWYCGHVDLPTIGQIVYLKNENTKTRKIGNKTKPFEWKDPSAFYFDIDGYTTVKSSNETAAMDNKDIFPLVSKTKIRKEPPKSIVISNNEYHNKWKLVVPCTNPANNKIFDIRHTEINGSFQETIRTVLPSERPLDKHGLDGWKQPKGKPSYGITCFVKTALDTLTYADWAILWNAANFKMHDSPAAFTVLTTLYWKLRNKNISGLPSQNVAWLMLKIMAAVPLRIRVLQKSTRFNPLSYMPKQQPNELRRNRSIVSPYPVSFPQGRRLESALRAELLRNMRNRFPEAIDWVGLCHDLDQLCEKNF